MVKCLKRVRKINESDLRISQKVMFTSGFQVFNVTAKSSTLKNKRSIFSHHGMNEVGLSGREVVGRGSFSRYL